MAPNIKDKRVSEFRTICEVHREIHDILINDKSISDEVSDKLTELLQEAYVMAKKMNNKLRQYKHNYDDGWWEKNRNIKEKLDKRRKK